MMIAHECLNKDTTINLVCFDSHGDLKGNM